MGFADPDGLLELRAYARTDGSLYWTFTFTFDPLSIEDAKGLGSGIIGKIGRASNKFDNFIKFASPRPATDSGTWDDYWACGILDGKLLSYYESQFNLATNDQYRVGEEMRRGPTLRMLKGMWEAHPEMSNYYSSPEKMLNEAIEKAKSNPFNKARNWIHGEPEE